MSECRCQHCEEMIAFEAARAGEDVACPRCASETKLFLRLAAPAPAQVARSSWSLHWLRAIPEGNWVVMFALGCFTAALFMRLGLLGLAAVAAGAVYLFPTLLALRRNDPDGFIILCWNLLTGWTVWCWFIALGWALRPRGRRRRV